MKTPRELLLERHAELQQKLDTLREEAVASLAEARPTPAKILWRELLLSLRWHLAGLSAAWMLIFFLNLESRSGASTDMAGNKPVPTPAQVLAALHEQRRQLLH